MKRKTLDWAAAIVALALLLATPYVLTTCVGVPWSIGRSTTAPVLTFVASVAAWIGWVACAHSLIRRVISYIRLKDIDSYGGGVDWVAGRTAAIVISLAALVHGSAAAAQPMKVASHATSLSAGSVGSGPPVGMSIRASMAVGAFGGGNNQLVSFNGNHRGGQGQHLAAPRVEWQLDKTVDAGSLALINVPVAISEMATSGICWLGVLSAYRRFRSRRSCRRTLDDVAASASGFPLLAARTRNSSFFAIASLIVSLRDAAEFERTSLHLVRVGTSEVELVLGEPVETVPHGGSLTRSGYSMLFQLAGIPHDVAASGSYVGPLLLPICRDEAGEWALALHSGTVVGFLGPNASDLVSDMASSIADLPFEGPVDIRPAVGGFYVVWGHDQSALITTLPPRDFDLAVVVDKRALTIHPFGLVLKPERDLAEPSLVSIEAETTCPVDQAPYSSPIEVKLLTAVPRIEGLQEHLPPNRARRAIELLAYLSIHYPDPVSSDRLRTRVLGTPDSDAAAKTLFNTIGAARRALGVNADGTPHLPNASRSGHYTISQSIGSDVRRVGLLFEKAREARSDNHALALYRAAFELIESEPLSGSLSGYGWWRAEGHEARFISIAVDAACAAVRLAIRSGLLEFATWIVDRGRLLDPYSEQLSRGAMTIAAATGDRARLNREWDECQRRVSELDPSGSPSAETELLFRRLARSAAAAVRGGQSDYASFAAIDEAPRRMLPSAPVDTKG